MTKTSWVTFHGCLTIPANNEVVPATEVVPPVKIDDLRAGTPIQNYELPRFGPVFLVNGDQRELLNPTVFSKGVAAVHSKTKVVVRTFYVSDLEVPELEAFLRYDYGYVEPVLASPPRLDWREAIDRLRSDPHLRTVYQRRIFNQTGNGQLTFKQEQQVLYEVVSKSSIEKYSKRRSQPRKIKVAQEDDAEQEEANRSSSVGSSIPEALSGYVSAEEWQAAKDRWAAIRWSEQYDLPSFEEIANRLASARTKRGDLVVPLVVRTLADPQGPWDNPEKVEQIVERVRDRLEEHAPRLAND